MTIEQIVPAEHPDVASVTPIAKEPDAASTTSPAKEPDAESVTTAAKEHVNDDHRAEGHWESRWSTAARVGIRIDAAYVGVVFFLTLVMLLLTWRGTTYELLAYGCTSCSPIKFNQYAFFFIGGVLGGTMFGLKYLYKVVARGYWNIDRRLWRIFSGGCRS